MSNRHWLRVPCEQLVYKPPEMPFVLNRTLLEYPAPELPFVKPYKFNMIRRNKKTIWDYMFVTKKKMNEIVISQYENSKDSMREVWENKNKIRLLEDRLLKLERQQLYGDHVLVFSMSDEDKNKAKENGYEFHHNISESGEELWIKKQRGR